MTLTDTKLAHLKWLTELPVATQEQYFVVRNQSYIAHWEQRLGNQAQVGLRDEFDDDYVVAAVGADGAVLGGVRASVVRPTARAVKSLPLEKHGGILLSEMFPEHRLDEVSYAEAGKLFLAGNTNPAAGRALTLRMLDYLLDNVADVAVVYFCIPAILRHNYRVLSQTKGFAYVYRELEALTSSYIGGDVKKSRWGIFACLLHPTIGSHKD